MGANGEASGLGATVRGPKFSDRTRVRTWLLDTDSERGIARVLQNATTSVRSHSAEAGLCLIGGELSDPGRR